jgi:hypothetical protein
LDHRGAFSKFDRLLAASEAAIGLGGLILLAALRFRSIASGL